LASSDIPPAAYHHRYALLRGAALLARDLPPRCVAAPIHVWWSAETIARHGGPPVDWQQYTAGAVHTAILPGDHIAAVQGADVHSRLRETLEVLDPAERAPERAERTTLTRESP
ncbi:hypothetical protein BE08_30350, partial [Sorangium cellulosum]